MNPKTKRLLLVGAVLACLGSAVLAGPGDGPTTNPPPVVALNNFASYEMLDLTILPPYAGQGANEKAADRIRQNLQGQVTPILQAWSAAGAKSGYSGTLVIEPQISEIKFIGGATRFWVGAMAGSSYVILKLKITEQPSGRVIAEPEFFQRAAAMSGAYTMGGQDNDMLQRIVTLVNGYINGNHEAAVGGATGRVDKGKKR
jgi:hypothetical protein